MTMAAGATAWRPCDFQSGLSDFFESARDVLDKVSRGYAAMARSQGHYGSGEGRFSGRKGPGRWGGGFVGPKGAWWPTPPTTPGPKASRGDVRAAILALLREGPRNGYQIMSEIEERSGGAWRPSPGAVYPALSQLADEGLIAAEESAGRRVFSLTEAGREYTEQNPGM